MSSSLMNLFGVALGLPLHITRPAACFIGNKVAISDKILDPPLERAGCSTRELDELSEGEGFVIGEECHDFPGERVEVGDAG